MAEVTNEQYDDVPGYGTIQTGTTEFLTKTGELDFAQNSRFDKIGGVRKTEGYAKVGNDLTSTSSTSTSTSTTTTSTSSSTTTTSTSTTTTSTSTSTTRSTSTSTTTS